MKEQLDKLNEAMISLDNLRNDYVKAVETSSQASAIETNCLNALNIQQRQVDRILTEIKKSMPIQTDWKRNQSKNEFYPVKPNAPHQ